MFQRSSTSSIEPPQNSIECGIISSGTWSWNLTTSAPASLAASTMRSALSTSPRCSQAASAMTTTGLSSPKVTEPTWRSSGIQELLDPGLRRRPVLRPVEVDRVARVDHVAHDALAPERVSMEHLAPAAPDEPVEGERRLHVLAAVRQLADGAPVQRLDRAVTVEPELLLRRVVVGHLRDGRDRVRAARLEQVERLPDLERPPGRRGRLQDEHEVGRMQLGC